MPVVGRYTKSLNDKSAETSTVTVNTAVITDGTDFDNFIAPRDAFSAAINGLSLGTSIKVQYGNCDITATTNTASASGSRELKLLVRYHDAVSFKNYSMEIPAFKESLTLSGSDEIDPSAVEWIAFIAAAEAYALSPTGGAIIIDGGTLVGRNI